MTEKQMRFALQKTKCRSECDASLECEHLSTAGGEMSLPARFGQDFYKS